MRNNSLSLTPASPRASRKSRLVRCGIAAALAFLSLLTTGCKTKEFVPVPEYHHTTEVAHQRDTLIRKDSIVMHTFTRGDTVYLQEKHFHNTYNVASRDSVVLVRDSVGVPYPVYIEKKASKFDRLIIIFFIMTGLVLCFYSIFLLCAKMKAKP